MVAANQNFAQIHNAGGCPTACRPYGHVPMRQFEFPSTVEANFVRTMFDREHTAEMTMPAAKNKLKDVEQEFHKSCVRWRRSQSPFASNHSSCERTLARQGANRARVWNPRWCSRKSYMHRLRSGETPIVTAVEPSCLSSIYTGDGSDVRFPPCNRWIEARSPSITEQRIATCSRVQALILEYTWSSVWI